MAHKELVLVAVVVLAAVALPGPTASPAAAEDGAFLTKTYDGREYRLYVPPSYDGSESVPLLVMLHGCNQTPTDFAAGTDANELADREGVLVLYPEQTEDANSERCWNWFDTDHQERGAGEPALIKGMTDQVEANYEVDAHRVYVAGMSAGGAMSVIMGATYPHQYAAIGVHSGLEYKAAESASGAFYAMDNGGPDPDQQGIEAYHEMDVMARQVPTIVFHGFADDTVDKVNGNQTTLQWAQTHDMADNDADDDSFASGYDRKLTGTSDGGYDYTTYLFEDDAGTVLVNYTLVRELGHDWSGGSTDGSYTDPAGPDATTAFWSFFESHPLEADHQRVLIDDFEDNDDLQDYDEDAHEGSPFLNDYFVDTTDDGGYDGVPWEGSYDLGAYSDDDYGHPAVHTHSYDTVEGAPNTLPRAGDVISYYTQADCLSGYCSTGDPATVKSGFIFGAQNATHKYMAYINYESQYVALLKRTADGWTFLDWTDASLDPKGHWYEVRIDWGTDGSMTMTVYDAEGDGSVVATASATDATWSAGGVGFYKAGGTESGDGLYSLAYWDQVTVNRTVG